jgi:hypothetical protein
MTHRQSSIATGRFTCMLYWLVVVSFLLSTSVLAESSSTGSSSSSSSGTEPDPYASNPFSFGLDFVGGNGLEHLIAIVLLIWGLTLLFFGVRLFKFSLFIIAWFAVGSLVYYLAFLASKGDSKAAFISAMVFGILAGCIVIKLYKIGLTFVGVFCAYILWEVFVSLFPHAVPAGGSYTFLVLALIGGGLLARYFQKWILLCATPIIGTFMFSQGLSKYLEDTSLQLNALATMHGNVDCDNDGCLGQWRQARWACSSFFFCVEQF